MQLHNLSFEKKSEGIDYAAIHAAIDESFSIKEAKVACKQADIHRHISNWLKRLVEQDALSQEESNKCNLCDNIVDDEKNPLNKHTLCERCRTNMQIINYV